MAGLERLGEGLERVWKGFGKGDGGAWTAWHEVLDKALALSRSEKLMLGKLAGPKDFPWFPRLERSA